MDPIDEFFSKVGPEPDPDPVGQTYPGSRHERRRPLPPPEKAVEWDKHGYIKIIRGRRVELFTIGALAAALRRSSASIRHWTRKGYLPQAPFRLPPKNGVAGRRLYTRAMVESVILLFAERDLLVSDRVEWCEHPDLPGEIQKSWSRLYEEVIESDQEENP